MGNTTASKQLEFTCTASCDAPPLLDLWPTAWGASVEQGLNGDTLSYKFWGFDNTRRRIDTPHQSSPLHACQAFCFMIKFQ